MRIQDGEVYVNGQLETRRGKQLAEHDEVRLDTVTAVVEIDVD